MSAADSGLASAPDGALHDGDAADASSDATNADLDAGPDDAGFGGGSGSDGGPAEAGMPPAQVRVSVPRPADPGVITNWNQCGETTRLCGSMRVPIDYANPAAGDLRLAIMRNDARKERLGALLLNPGGPGTSAIEALGSFLDTGSSPLIDHFDLVAFDPRGIGYSTALNCHSQLQQLYAVDPSPDSEAEWSAIDAVSAAFALECQQAHAELLPHLGTVNVARDMDAVRAALGEAKLNYLGLSYGTAIGAHYAEIFPGNVGRMVLDSPVDLKLSATDIVLQQAQGFERGLERYFGWCREDPVRCTWTRGGDPVQAFASLKAAVEVQPLTAQRAVGPGEFITATSATLYRGLTGWMALSQALEQALAGDGVSLLGFVDGYLQRNPDDGSYPNREEVYHAVNCVDRVQSTADQLRDPMTIESFSTAAPNFGLPALTSLFVCARWPVPGQTVPVPQGQGAPPIVVLGSLGDPATPYTWAQAFARDLVSSTLLTSDGESHGAYGVGNQCIDDAVHAYLFDGAIPAPVNCEGSPRTSALIVNAASARRMMAPARSWGSFARFFRGDRP